MPQCGRSGQPVSLWLPWRGVSEHPWHLLPVGDWIQSQDKPGYLHTVVPQWDGHTSEPQQDTSSQRRHYHHYSWSIPQTASPPAPSESYIRTGTCTTLHGSTGSYSPKYLLFITQWCHQPEDPTDNENLLCPEHISSDIRRQQISSDDGYSRGHRWTKGSGIP